MDRLLFVFETLNNEQLLSGLTGSVLGILITVLLYAHQQRKHKENVYALIYLDLQRMEDYVYDHSGPTDMPFNYGWQNLVAEVERLKPEHQKTLYEIYSIGYRQAEYEKLIRISNPNSMDKHPKDGAFGKLSDYLDKSGEKNKEYMQLKDELLKRSKSVYSNRKGDKHGKKD